MHGPSRALGFRGAWSRAVSILPCPGLLLCRNLTGVEEREAGNLSMKVVFRYFRSGGSLFALGMLLFLYGAEQAARVYCDKW